MKTIAILQHDLTYAESRAFTIAANDAQALIRFRDVYLPPDALRGFAKERLSDGDAFREAFALKGALGLEAEDGVIVVTDANVYDHESDEYFFVASSPEAESERPYPAVGVLSTYYLAAHSSFMRDAKTELDKLDESARRALFSNLALLLVLGLVTQMLTDVPAHDDQVGCVLDYCQTPADVRRAVRRGFVFCQTCSRLLATEPAGSAILQIAADLTPAGVAAGPERFIGPIDMTRPIPLPAQNNRWYVRRASGKVIVFVHGVLSDSRACWLRPGEGDDHERYWPELVARDERFSEYSIFLGGYFTDVDAAEYGVEQAGAELAASLGREQAPGVRPVLEHESIVFVCHSLGGIVVRYLLAEHREKLRDKDIGLLLVASPTRGSWHARLLRGIAAVFSHRMARELEWESERLQETDRQFQRLLDASDSRYLPRLRGKEAYENHFRLRLRWLPPLPLVVPRVSAAKYFANPLLLRDTDHSSIVKPDGPSHPAHEMLVDFCGRRA